MLASSPTRTFSLLQLICVAGISLGLPMALCRSDAVAKWLRFREPKAPVQKRVMEASGGVQDVASGQEILQKHRPDWVLIGNSMLHSRVDHEYLKHLTGQKVYKLSISSTKSAMWYLMLKRIVVESAVKPKCVTVFFRDRDLTWPAQRMQRNEEMIERMQGRQEPEWDIVMGSYDAAIRSPLDGAVEKLSGGMNALFPADKLREWARNKVQKTAFNLSSFGSSMDYPERRSELNDLLSMDHQRQNARGRSSADSGQDDSLPDEAEDMESREPLVFDPSPESSFLPHMVALAEKHGFKLHFHRIKLNPAFPGKGNEAELTLPAYLRALQDYLESKGCLYTDESVEHEITSDMYVDHSHIKSAPVIQQAYMNVFWRHVQSSIAGLLPVNREEIRTRTGR